jgi:hypothetical protein
MISKKILVENFLKRTQPHFENQWGPLSKSFVKND